MNNAREGEAAHRLAPTRSEATVRLAVYRPLTIAAFVVIAGIGNGLGYLFFFDIVWSYDKAMHVYTSFAVTLGLAWALRDSLIARLESHRPLIVYTLVAYVVGLGVLWEIAEWLVDIGAYPDIIKGKTDTMLDLIADGIGALCAALWVTGRFAR